MCYFVLANFLVKYLYLCLAKIRITYWKFRFLSIVGRQDQIQSRGRNTISQSIGFQSYGQLVTTWHASVHKGGAVRMTRFQQNHCAGRTMQVAQITTLGRYFFFGPSTVFICTIYLRNRIKQTRQGRRNYWSSQSFAQLTLGLVQIIVILTSDH